MSISIRISLNGVDRKDDGYLIKKHENGADVQIYVNAPIDKEEEKKKEEQLPRQLEFEFEYMNVA